MKILVNSCIRELDRKEVRVSIKSGAVQPPEGRGERSAVSKFRRAATIKISIEDRKRSNIAADFERL